MLRELATNGYGQKIMAQVDALVAGSTTFPVAIYLEGGDYDMRTGISEFAIQSLQLALSLANNIIFKYRKKVKVILGTFINDLGQKDKQTTGGAQLLPDFEQLTAASPVYKKDLFVVSLETNAKNRGIKTLKRLLSGVVPPHLLPGYLVPETIAQGQHIFFSEQRTRVLLAEVSQEKWALKCPMLMAQHYLDIVALMRKRVPGAATCALIDFSERIDSHKVENGALIATRLLERSGAEQHVVISNHFFWDAEGAMISGSSREFRRQTVTAITPQLYA